MPMNAVKPHWEEASDGVTFEAREQSDVLVSSASIGRELYAINLKLASYTENAIRSCMIRFFRGGSRPARLSGHCL